MLARRLPQLPNLSAGNVGAAGAGTGPAVGGLLRELRKLDSDSDITRHINVVLVGSVVEA
jgi:hypothetical protein